VAVDHFSVGSFAFSQPAIPAGMMYTLV